MRSPAAVASALAILLAFPLAIASSLLGEDAPGVVVHIVLGAGAIGFAIATFDFALPRWLNAIGAAAGIALGSIFLLQAVSLMVPDATLDNLAFAVLGQNGEKVAVDAILLWYLGLLLGASGGRTRLVGWPIVAIGLGLELASYVAMPLGIAMPNLKIVFFASFAWLLLEGAKGWSAGGAARRILGRRAPASLA